MATVSTRTRAPDAARSLMSVLSRAGAENESGVSEAIDDALAALVKKRRAKWYRRFAEAVAEIGRRTDESTLSALCRNEHFLTVSLEAAQIARRNHSDEKLDALKWIVVHAALPEAANEEIQSMFVRYVDELTPAHLFVLLLLDRPPQWVERQGMAWPHWGWGTVSSLIQYCMPALRGQPEAIEQVVRELQTRGLIEAGPYLRAPTSDAALQERRTTLYGRTFIATITGA